MKTVEFVGYLLLSAGFVICLYLGYKEDQRYGTSPTGKHEIVQKRSGSPQNSPSFALNNRN